MSRGFPSMTALLGLLASQAIRTGTNLPICSVVLVEVPRQHRGNRVLVVWAACLINSAVASAALAPGAS